MFHLRLRVALQVLELYLQQQITSGDKSPEIRVRQAEGAPVLNSRIAALKELTGLKVGQPQPTLTRFQLPSYSTSPLSHIPLFHPPPLPLHSSTEVSLAIIEKLTQNTTTGSQLCMKDSLERPSFSDNKKFLKTVRMSLQSFAFMNTNIVISQSTRKVSKFSREVF